MSQPSCNVQSECIFHMCSEIPLSTVYQKASLYMHMTCMYVYIIFLRAVCNSDILQLSQLFIRQNIWNHLGINCNIYNQLQFGLSKMHYKDASVIFTPLSFRSDQHCKSNIKKGNYICPCDKINTFSFDLICLEHVAHENRVKMTHVDIRLLLA